jgi:drug/metabolite transporter (DMT)-like permease
MTSQMLLLIAVVLAGAAGDVCVARAMKTVGELTNFGPTALFRFGLATALNGYLWLGVFWKAVAFFCFLALVADADLSWVVPATAISFVVELIAAKLFLRESVNPLRWAGALCITAGVALISL